MSRKFHILFKTLDRAVTGNVFPQAERVSAKTDRLPEGRVKLGSLAMEVTSLDGEYRLTYRAKLTDYLSSIGIGYPTDALISARFYDLLRDLHAPNFSATPARVIDRRGLTYEYYILHQPNHLSTELDYERTVFTFTSYPEEEVFDFKVDSYEALNEFVHSRSGLYVVKKLYLSPSVFEYDFFTLWAGVSGWLISEELRARLVEADISGIVTVPFVQGDSFVESIFDKVSSMAA